ncbi:MAG: ArsA-related P-loop ATPase [Myxococcota bacterium]
MDSFAHPLQLVTGKGGVGKSSVVAALAQGAAEAGKRPLIVELGHRATMESIFGVPVGYRPREVSPGVSAMNVAFEDAVVDYIAEQVRVRRLAQRIARSSVLSRFLGAAPAVSEVVTLRLLQRLVDAGEYAPIFVDLDATGHARMFLSLPEVFDGLVESGPLRALLDRTTELLRDPARSVLHLVTLPSALPAQETRELHAALRDANQIALGALIVNRVPREPLGPRDVAQLDTWAAEHPGDVALARQEQQRAVDARDVVESLRALSLRVIEVPELDAPLDLLALARALRSDA